MGPNFKGLAELAIAGLISIAILFLVGIYSVIDYFFITDTYKTKKQIVPEVVIKTETKNGTTKSDTTYIYTLN